MRGRLAAACAAVLSLTLAACAGPPPVNYGDRSVAAPASADEAAGTETASLPEASRTEKPIDDDPRHLIGLDPKAVIALLGEPRFRRNDRPAELWRYRGGSCMLDIFLYGPDAAADKDKRVRVRYVESRPTGDSTTNARACLHGLLRARRDGKAG